MESSDLNIGTDEKIKNAVGNADNRQPVSDEDVMAISKRLIEKNRQAYEKLAK